MIINSNVVLDNYLKSNFSSKLKLEYPLFYNEDIGIRFEIGNPDDTISDEEYWDQVHHRALTLFKDIHQVDDEMLVVLHLYRKKMAKPIKIKVFKDALKHRKVIRNLSCTKLHYANDENEGWESYRYVLKCKCSDLKYERILFSFKNIFLINVSKHTIFYLYDSRGLDVVSNSKEALKNLYVTRNEWILDYDREHIDTIFN